MPFTLSHPAAVLPLARTPLPLSALVAGSVAPDVPYFLPVTLPWATHTLAAVVTVDVALGALVWAAWHGLVVRPALAAAPPSVRDRLTGCELGLRSRLRTPRACAWTVAALVVGAATHVLWDELTHGGR